MGEAKRRGTYEQRVALATEASRAAAAAKRQAAFDAAKLRMKAEREAEEAERETGRVDLGGGRAIVARGGTNRRMNDMVVMAALVAALTPSR
jgi:hypothetical protein